jgi:transcriptional regulator with XRE-family HTH domain
MRGLNLPDVARATAHLPSSQRVSHPYLSHIELGVVFRPEPERLQSIARVLGIPEAWILEKAGYNADGTISESAYVESSPSSQQIKTDIAQLDPADREWLLPMLEAIMRIRRAEGKAGER